MTDMEALLKDVLEDEVVRRARGASMPRVRGRRALNPRWLDAGRLIAAAALVALVWMGMGRRPTSPLAGILETAAAGGRIEVIVVKGAEFVNIALGEGSKSPAGGTE